MFTGFATIFIQGLPRVFKGYYSLRVTWRNDISKAAKLLPRKSDEDWQAPDDIEMDGEQGAAGIGGADGSTAVTEDSLRGFFATKEVTTAVEGMIDFFHANRIDVPVSCRMLPCRVSNNTLMGIMAEVPALSNDKEIVLLTAGRAALEVEKELPVDEWSEIVAALASAKRLGVEYNKINLPDTLADLADVATAKVINALRAETFLYALSAIGQMKCRNKDGNSNAYLPSHCLQVVGDQLRKFDVAQHGVQHFETGNDTFLEPLVKGMEKDGWVGTLSWLEAAKSWVGVRDPATIVSLVFNFKCGGSKVSGNCS